MKLNEFFNYWLPVVFWAGFIFYLSSIPNLKASGDPFLDEVIRSFLHVLFYLFFALLWWRALRLLRIRKRLFFAFLFVFLYSLTDEIHQHLVPTRQFQLVDLLVDNLGSFLGIFLTWRLLPKLSGRIRFWAKKLALVNDENI